MGITKITPAQQAILEKMQKGYVLSSQFEAKYRPFDMPHEFGARIYHPNYDLRYMKSALISTIKAMLNKELIVEDSRYICGSGTDGGHKYETWCIHYKLNLCISCYEQPASVQFNNMFCADCAKNMGDAWEVEYNKHMQEATA